MSRTGNLNKYLKRRCGRGRSGQRRYLQVPVPKDLRPRFGRTCIEQSLKTSDPRIARKGRNAALLEVRAMFDRARAEPTLGEVLAAARREELICASATWLEAIAGRGFASMSCSFAAMLVMTTSSVGSPDAPHAYRTRWRQRLRL